MIKGMWEWADYLAAQLELVCEDTPWGKYYTVPPHSGRGQIEAVQSPGLWVIWRCDIVINKKLQTTYTQEDPYYISFAYRDTSFAGRTRDSSWPSDEVIRFENQPGMSMKAVGVFFFTKFFEQLVNTSIMDLILSIRSYDEETLMKPITPILRQMFEYTGKGPAMRLFLESRLLELAATLIDMAESEKPGGKITLSAYDSSQLHKVLEILETSLTNPPRISELSHMLALNEHKLKAGFRQLFGTTIYEYLRLIRMEKATELLEQTDLTPAQVGQKVGYQTPHGFNNAFKKYYSKTPLEWQNERSR